MSDQKKRGPRRRAKRKSRLLPAVIVVGLVVALAVGLYIYVSPAMKQDTIYPNVTVAGVNVGGMSKMEAEQAVREAMQSGYASESMCIQLPDRTVELPSDVIQVDVKVEDAIDAAWRYGRTGSLLQRAAALRKAEKQEHKIELTADMELDAPAVRTQLQKLSQELQSEPVQTKLDLDVENNLLTIAVGTAGKTLDTTELYERIYQAYLDGSLEPIVFEYEVTEPDYVDLQTIYEKIGKSASDAYLDETTGEIVPEQIGYGFDLAAVQQRLALAEEGEVIQVELQSIEPEVTEAMLRETYFRDVLSSYDSYLSWNPGRTTNVTLACAAMNGTVIMPGEVFSFNRVVGERTKEKGYQEATVYLNGSSVGETGGGVCQAASTLYYCTLLANLEVTEREEHMFTVTYVPAGCDATIYWGQLDYCFRNNTDYPIRVDAKVENDYCKIALVGTKTDDTYVEMVSEELSKTAWKTVDEDGHELVLAPEYGENVYLNKDDNLYYQSVEKVETAYTGYYYITYRNVYNGDGTLLSSEKEDSSYYAKRDQKHKVVLMEPQPNAEPEPEPEPEPDPDWDLPWSEPTTDPGVTGDEGSYGVSIGGGYWP